MPLLCEKRGHVAILTLSRPEARNALSSEVLRLLPQLMTEADERDDVDVLILTGADPAFTAGLDLKELGDKGFGRGATEAAVADGDVIQVKGAQGGQPNPCSRTLILRGNEKIRVKPHRMAEIKTGDIVVKLNRVLTELDSTLADFRQGQGAAGPAECDPHRRRPLHHRTQPPNMHDPADYTLDTTRPGSDRRRPQARRDRPPASWPRGHCPCRRQPGRAPPPPQGASARRSMTDAGV